MEIPLPQPGGIFVMLDTKTLETRMHLAGNTRYRGEPVGERGEMAGRVLLHQLVPDFVLVCMRVRARRLVVATEGGGIGEKALEEDETVLAQAPFLTVKLKHAGAEDSKAPREMLLLEDPAPRVPPRGLDVVERVDRMGVLATEEIVAVNLGISS